MARGLGALMLLAVFGSPSALLAQELTEPAARQGYWIGGGYRSVLMYSDSEDVGGVGPFLGTGFTLRLGQMSNDWIGFGVAFMFAGGGGDIWNSAYGGLSLDVNLEPPVDEDLTIRLGTGVAGLSLSRVDESQARSSDPDGTFGALFTVGASYDLFPFYDRDAYESGGFAFTGFVELQALPGDGLLTVSGLVGLEVTYYFGFPKNKLDLPPDAAFEVED